MTLSAKDDDDLPPELLRIIEALAEAQARRDYHALVNSPSEAVFRLKPSLRYRKFLAKSSKNSKKRG